MKKRSNRRIKTDILYLVVVMVVSTMVHTACTSDTLPEVINNLPCKDDHVVYINQISPLIDTYCTISGCHDSGSPVGDYTSFSSMQSAGLLNDSSFKNRVIDRADGDSGKMPPLNANSLTVSESDLELFQCWINQGYLEN